MRELRQHFPRLWPKAKAPDLRGPVANALGGTGDGPEHPAPPTSGRSGSTTPSAELLAADLGDLRPCDIPGGWQEFEVTLSFYVTSDDPEVIERERQRIWDALPDAAIEVADA